MGKIGVKVWVFKGDLMPGEKADQNVQTQNATTKDNASFTSRTKRNEETQQDKVQA